MINLLGYRKILLHEMATNDRNRNSDKTFLINKLKKKKVNQLRELCEIFEEGNGRMRKKECVEILTSVLLNIYFGYIRKDIK